MTQRNIHKISAYRNSNKDDGSWFAYLQKMLDEVALEDDGVQVTICNVPRPLLESKPEVFLPQLIAIGPYHHWRPELYDMEKYKLSAVKRIQRKSPHLKFKDLVDSILVHECRIRENYHKNLDFHRDTLGGLMAIDTCFLLEFLEVYLDDENGSAQTKSFGRISSRMMHLVDNTGQKSGHNIILRDIIMLENQIPLFLLLKILNWEHQTSNNEQFLIKILGGLIKELCPLKTTENIPIDIRLTKHAHLLALLYHSLLPCRIETSVAISERTESEIKEVPVEAPISDRDDGIKFKGETTHATQLCNKVWSILAVSGLRAVKPLLVIMRIPWKIVAIIPGVSLLIKPFGFLFPGGDVTPEQLIDGDKDKPPLMEEISIPSVEELISSGIKLVPTNGDLTTIMFDYSAAKLHLPTIALDVNTEVILRNLVAYETSVVSGPLVFTRYTELMNGIIDTVEDVRLLRRSGILKNYMKSDQEVAEVWNGMSRSVRLTKVPFMDNMIRDVNKFYNSRWKVKAKKLMKKYIVRSVGIPVVSYPNNSKLPKEFDARTAWPHCPTISNILDQGHCGSCWAFAAVESLSDRFCIHLNISVELSVNDLLSCCGIMCGYGCDGGYPYKAWQYFVKYGVVTSECNPYFDDNGCAHPGCEPVYPTPSCVKKCKTQNLIWGESKHYGVNAYAVSSDPQSIMAEIYNNGPVEVDFTVYEDFALYKSGVYKHITGGVVGGHAVKMIGWGTSDDGADYWLLANQWNRDWGENGYFKILRATNECGIEENAVAGLPSFKNLNFIRNHADAKFDSDAAF